MCSHCGCTSSKKWALWLPKIAFGLVLTGYGVNHLRNLEAFRGMASGVFTTMPEVGQVAGFLAYLVPALMIIGGILFAVGQLKWLSKICILGALSGIMGWAGLAVLLGDGSAGGTMMPLIQNAALLMVLYYVIKKMCCKKCCKGGCGQACTPGQCTCGNGSCSCK